MSEGLGEKNEFTPRDRWLMAAYVGGPMAWFLHLTICYTLVPESCDRGTKMLLHLVTLGCLAVALISVAIAWRIRAASPNERARWVADCAVILSLSMAIIIVAQEVPNIVLRSCD